MKKIWLTIAVTLLFTTAWSQSQLTTVRGKTKEGKTIKVEYYQGTVEDYVESVKYQLVDELQARVNDLQGKLDAANKQVKDLKNGQAGGGSAEVKRLNAEINELNKSLDNLQGQLVASELGKDSIAMVNSGLEKDVQAMEQRVQSLEKELAMAHSGYGQSVPVIGVMAGIGPVFMSDELSEGWSKDVNWMKRGEVYYGTARLTESFPLSIEAGIGVRNYAVSANSAACEQTVNATDADGDTHQAIYTYSNRTERIGLTYIDIPIRICFGQPSQNHMSVYAKVGVTPSIKVASSFNGTGTYSLKGYYQQWDVTLENIEELDFGSDFNCYDDVKPNLNTFILWGNLMLGGYMPLGKLPLLVNAGVGLDFPFITIGKATEGMHLLSNGGKVVIPKFEIGLVIAL